MVTKKAPNVLDKSKVAGSGGAGGGGSARTSVSSAPATPDVDIKKLTVRTYDQLTLFAAINVFK